MIHHSPYASDAATEVTANRDWMSPRSYHSPCLWWQLHNSVPDAVFRNLTSGELGGHVAFGEEELLVKCFSRFCYSWTTLYSSCWGCIWCACAVCLIVVFIISNCLVMPPQQHSGCIWQCHSCKCFFFLTINNLSSLDRPGFCTTLGHKRFDHAQEAGNQIHRHSVPISPIILESPFLMLSICKTEKWVS